MRVYAMAQRPSGINFFLQMTSSQESLGQIQPNLVGNMLGGMGIQICSNKGAGPFWGPIRGKIRNILIKIFFS